MICAHCHEPTKSEERCPSCGNPPILEGRYRLEEVLGSGASGTTFRATNLESNDSVAIKELDWRKLDSLKTEELFEREADTLRTLLHPGIPRYIETFTNSSGRHVTVYLVQEFVDGQTLEDERFTRRYTVDEVLEIGAEVLEILAYLHEEIPRVIHRDVKPKNVMRRTAGDLVLIDFGSVRSVIDEEGGSTIAGTIGYMAPEQLSGEASPASDIYGVGALMVTLLSKTDPHLFLGPGMQGAWRDEVPSDLDPQVVELFSMMLKHDPHERISDARFAQRWIRDILEGEEKVAPATSSNDWGNDWSETPALRMSPEEVLGAEPEGELEEDFYVPENVQQESRTLFATILFGSGVAVAICVAIFLAVQSSKPTVSAPSTSSNPPEPTISTEEVGQLGLYAQLGMPMSELAPRTQPTDDPLVRRGNPVFARLHWDCEFFGSDETDPPRLIRFECVTPLTGKGFQSFEAIRYFAVRKYGQSTGADPNLALWTTDGTIMRLDKDGPRARLEVGYQL